MSLNLQGVYGRLGNLGVVDPKFDIAVSTAAGNKLNFIVVDNAQVATLCLNEIKKNKLGKVTFIILDKVDHYFEMKNIPNGAELLLKKIKINDSKFLPAFYFAVKDTLLVNDIDKATQVAFHSGKRHRVVTTGGSLIDTSGTMTGGGSSVKSGGMSLISEKEYQNIQNYSNEIDEKYNNLREEIQLMKSKLSNNNIDLLETEISKLKIDFETTLNQINTIEQQIIDIKSIQDEDHSFRINELNLIIEKNLEIQNIKSIEVKELNDSIKKLEQKIFDLIKNKKDKKNKEIKNIEDKLEEKRKLILKFNSKINLFKKIINKNEKNIK